MVKGYGKHSTNMLPEIIPKQILVGKIFSNIFLAYEKKGSGVSPNKQIGPISYRLG